MVSLYKSFARGMVRVHVWDVLRVFTQPIVLGMDVVVLKTCFLLTSIIWHTQPLRCASE
jgi:hypothetical protein